MNSESRPRLRGNKKIAYENLIKKERRTKHGTEDWIEKKLNTWFNGVYTTGYSEDIRLHYLEQQEKD